MKRCFISLIAIVCLGTHAQIPVTICYNAYGALTTKDSAVYIRKCTFDTTRNFFEGEVRDYLSDGKLVMTGYYKDRRKEGKFTFFHSNGSIAQEGLFLNNKMSGIWKSFYSDGSTKNEIEFLKDSARIIFFKEPSGKKVLSNGTGIWKDAYREGNDTILVEGNYYNGLKNGIWKGRLSTGDFLYSEKYRRGKYIKGDVDNLALNYQKPYENHFNPSSLLLQKEFFSALIWLPKNYYSFLNQRKKSVDFEDGSFIVLENTAYPEKGMGSYMRSCNEHMKYPKIARERVITGSVFVEFTVDETGTLSEFEVIRSVGAGCDEEAIRLIKLSGKWVSAKQNGLSIKSRVCLPVIFQLY